MKLFFSLLPEKWYNTICAKLALVVSFLIAVISLFIYFYFPQKLEKEEIKVYEEKSRAIAEMTAYSISPALFFHDIENINEVINSSKQNKDLVFFIVVDEYENIVAHYNKNSALNILEPESLLINNYNSISKDGLIYYVSKPVFANSRKIGKILIGLSLEQIRAEILESKKTIALMSLSIFSLGLVTVFIFSILITKPLNLMGQIFVQIANGDLTKRVKISSSYEVDQMAKSFNKMVDELLLTQNELEQMNYSLEKRVSDRTRKLRREINEKKVIEKKITASLREKEVLLKEIHHRVKNNMQIIQSLLYLQTKNIKDDNMANIFNESRNRIRSMALVHEKLYQSADLAKINLQDYIKDLVAGLIQTYSLQKNSIQLELDITKVNLNIDIAIPCGLILNELVSNSLKHAFVKHRNGQNKINITCNLPAVNKLSLIVQDNGIGLPSDINIRNTDSLGLRLVTLLVEKQLNGQLILDNDNGTRFNMIINI
ncbi:HAMP domain-containing protein [candidate division KSB1 bacterium]|nr:HAMP domain-containing protein [candidate division KSB1 bacterium]